MNVPLKNFLDSSSKAVLIKTNFKVDIISIIDFFEKEVKKYPKEYQFPKNFHGGWSIQSNTGDISDGWQIGGAASSDKGFQLSKKFENFIKGTFPNAHTNKFLIPTPLYQGIMKRLIEDLESLNFKARRTRIADLEPGGVDNWHIDNGFKETWRAHIAVITNDQSFFQWKVNNELLQFNIPVDGYMYLARIDKLHRVSNQGNTIRTHIIFDNDYPLRVFDATVEPVLMPNQA